MAVSRHYEESRSHPELRRQQRQLRRRSHRRELRRQGLAAGLVGGLAMVGVLSLMNVIGKRTLTSPPTSRGNLIALIVWTTQASTSGSSSASEVTLACLTMPLSSIANSAVKLPEGAGF